MQGNTRKRKTKSGFTTKSEANKWAVGVESKKINKTVSISDGLISDLFDDWYAVFKEPHLETKSKTWYRTASSTIRRYWPNKKISEVTSSDFQKLINDYGKSHVKSSVSHIKNMISSFVRYAVDEEYIFKDFTRNIKTYSNVPSKAKELKFLENDEMEYLIKSIKDNDSVTSHMILTAIYSGARYSEIAGLTKEDFNFSDNTISINKSWQENDKKFKSTKTVTSNRIIDMPDAFMNKAQTWNFGDSYAFESITGYPPSNTAANKQLARYLKRGDCKIITFHGLRHTHASYLLSKDISIQYVSERLGHADVNITLGTYAHLLKTKRNIETKKTMDMLNNL